MMHTIIIRLAAAVMALAVCPFASGGPYSAALNDPTNPFDAPVPGFTGPHGVGIARLVIDYDEEDEPLIENPDNYVHPLFFAWADAVINYVASESVISTYGDFSDPSSALGPVTGDYYHVVSLGDMSAPAISNGSSPGTITVRFAKPIRDLTGSDFVVFENAFIVETIQSGAVVGQVVGDLAYVEVSADGEHFTRFPAESLTAAAVNGYGSINATDVRNLAGKHINSGGESWGTPFDLAELGISEIQYIRLVDIPGNGAFTDNAGRPIFDPWKTFASGGFDLEAIGAVSVDMTYNNWPSLLKLAPAQRGRDLDPDGDGISNLLEYAFGLVPWEKDAFGSGWGFSLVTDAGSRFFELTTLRDERLIDMKREIQLSENLSSWETIAVSLAGSSFQAVGGHSLAITEESAGDIASVGVIRRDRIRVLHPVVSGEKRFYRLKISEITP